MSPPPPSSLHFWMCSKFQWDFQRAFVLLGPWPLNFFPARNSLYLFFLKSLFYFLHFIFYLVQDEWQKPHRCFESTCRENFYSFPGNVCGVFKFKQWLKGPTFPLQTSVVESIFNKTVMLWWSYWTWILANWKVIVSATSQ